MKNVMISYSHDDYEFIATLDAKLQEHQIDAWLDARDIRPGHRWRDEIFKAITACDYIIVCLSPTFIKSQMCRMEVYLARCYSKKILPIMIGEECWSMLSDYHELSGIDNLLIVNFVTNKVFGFRLTEDEQFQKIINAIQIDNAQAESPSVYVSYRATNAAYATKVADDLIAHGIKTWIATRSYQVGDKCLELQWESLMSAKVLIVILSDDAPDSQLIQNEVLVAITRNIPIIPVLVGLDNINSTEFTRKLSHKLVNSSSYEMRYLSEIHWFYPNLPDYPTMLEKLKNSILDIM